MRRICAAAIVLLAAWSCPAAEPESPMTTPWYKRIFSTPEPKPEPAPEPAPVKTFTRQDVSRSLDMEQKAFMERLQFCSKLRQVAAETGDEDLLKKADAIEQQASELYMKRTNKLPSLLEDAKAAEAHLAERRRPDAATATAERGEAPILRRAPNGRPIRE